MRPRCEGVTVLVMSSEPKYENVEHSGIHHGLVQGESTSVSRQELIEQVMRMTNDDRLLLPFLDAPAGSEQLLSATGRLLAAPPTPFPLSTPLAAWVGAESTCTSEWRSLIPQGDRSLWEDLEFLRSVVGSLGDSTSSFCCPYEELEHLRLAASSGFNDPFHN